MSSVGPHLEFGQRAPRLHAGAVLELWSTNDAWPSNHHLLIRPSFLWSHSSSQTWNMFAPPPRHITWHLIELNLKAGSKLELIKAGGLFHWRAIPWHTSLPEPLYQNYGNHRNFKYWEKYCALCFSWCYCFMMLMKKKKNILSCSYSYNSQNIDARLEFGRWVCREWNSRHFNEEMLITHKTHYYFTPADLYEIFFLGGKLFTFSHLHTHRSPDDQKNRIESEIMWDHSCI